MYTHIIHYYKSKTGNQSRMWQVNVHTTLIIIRVKQGTSLECDK
jgi:hypothetical protein